MRLRVLRTRLRMRSCKFSPLLTNRLQSKGLTEDNHRLKLGVYRSLSIDAEQDPNTGDFSRAVIRNTAKGSVNVVNLDPKFDRFFTANHFWNSM